MCDRCVEMDKKIDDYQRIASRITDQAMLDGIKDLIERMQLRRPHFIPSKGSKTAFRPLRAANERAHPRRLPLSRSAAPPWGCIANLSPSAPSRP
jgi:hypothetical protein